jgi:F0F1-type ATP synthase epsilon subunit
METFQLSILEENRTHYSGPAVYCGVMTPTGAIGFQARHEGFAGMLLPGSDVLFRDSEGKESKISAQWGILLFRDNQCTITLAAAPSAE